MKKLIIGLVVLLTCSACEKSNNDDEVVEWHGSFSVAGPGDGWTTSYFVYDLPEELPQEPTVTPVLVSLGNMPI